MIDVDQYTWTEEALGESEELLARVIETNVDALVIIAPDGRITFLNTAAEHLLGIPRDRMLGRSYADPAVNLMTQDGRPMPAEDRPTARVLRTGEAVQNAELLFERPDGKRIVLSVNVSPLTDAGGEVTGAVVSLRDVTEWRETEEALRQQAVTLRAQAELLDLAHDAIFVRDVKASTIVYWNRAAIGPLPQGHGLLGALIKEGEPLRVRNIAQDPRSHGFPPNHPPMTSLLGVPILSKGRAVGDLYLTDKIGADEFTEDDQNLLLVLAGHAAVAVENAQLYEDARAARDQLKSWNRNLEATVAERTREIEQMTRETTTRVLQAQEEERKRIARELHDETAQSLASLLITLDGLRPHIPEENGPLASGMSRFEQVLKRTLDEVRALSHDLRPAILDDFGLVAAMQSYADEWTETFGVPVRLDVEDVPDGRLPSDTEVGLFRVIQEALMNAGKYARARAVDILLSFADDAVLLVVQDDGVGFDAEQVEGPSRHGGLGLYGMRERAALLGGTLTIDTAPGKGTRITLRGPLP